MAAGFGHDAARHERAWRFVESLDPDFALLQESVVPAWAAERWPFVLGSRRYPANPSRQDVAWGAAILARDPATTAFAPGDETPLIRHLWGAVVVARTGGASPMWLASIHSNAYSVRLNNLPEGASLAGLLRCDDTKVWEVELIAHELRQVFGTSRFVAGGDLNSGLLFDTKYGRQSNARLFQNLAALGFNDLRKRFHDTEQRTYFKEGKGSYQLDHVFSDAETEQRALSWRVLADVAAVEELSDHAPIELSLEG
jgi:exonuclease III